MTRKLKTLIAAVMAFGVFGAFNAAGVLAAEEFHCSVEPCRVTLKPDGTGNTAHHVFAVKNSIGESISFTCSTLSGEGTSALGTAAGVTVTNMKYEGCKPSIAPKVSVDMNGCDYQIGSAAGLVDGGLVTILCPAGKTIEITAREEMNEAGEEKLVCTMRIPTQGPLKGVGYHNVVNGASQREVTATVKVPGIKVEPIPAPGGECVINVTKTPIVGELTTGNTLVTAEEDKAGGAMVEGWWE